jgi:WD40 repeat protein
VDLPQIRIFISSPGDVAEERIVTGRVIRRLQGEFRHRVALDAVFWEHEPLVATDTFQTQIPKPSEADIVITILWARLGSRVPGNITRADGSRYASGTEFEFEDAADCRRRTGSPDLLVYRKTVDPVVSLRDKDALLESLRQKEALDRFVSKWFHEDGSLIAAFHPFQTLEQYEELVEQHLRKLIARVPGAEATLIAPTWTEGSPFRGLEPFDREHAPIFFGRTRAVGEVLNAMRTQAARGRPFVLVLGASGAGKSSLVRAGVLPLLTQPGVMQGVRAWRQAIMRPSEASGDLVDGLAAALLRADALPELTQVAAATELADLLRRAPESASLLVTRIASQVASDTTAAASPARAPVARVAMVIDQLEEIFTMDRVTQAQRTAFAGALSALVRSEAIWALVTLRSDFYPRLAELPQLVALKEGAGQYDLLPPTASDIGQMIRQPARAGGLSFEKHPDTAVPLDDVLCDAALENPESLPLLEFALHRLYHQRTASGLLTFEAYEAIGGVEGALARHAEETFTLLAADVQAVFPEVVRELVRVESSERNAFTRRPAALASVTRNRARKAFVDAFIGARLFVGALADDATPTVMIAHEALLSAWPRLRIWLDDNREMLHVRGRVGLAAARWIQEARRSDLLLAEGKPLGEAEALLNASGVDIPDPERAFIQASRARARRARRIKKAAIAALIALTAMAGASAWISTKRLGEGLIAQADALALANRWRESKERYAQAATALRRIGLSPLAADLGLWDAYRYSPPPLSRIAAHENLIYAVAVSADGRFALSSGNDNRVNVWDLRTGRAIRTFEQPAQSLAFSQDGRRGLFADFQNDREVGISEWDLQNGEPLRSQTLRGHSELVWHVAFSPDGAHVLTGSADKTMALWEVASGRQVRVFNGHGDDVKSVAFSADGTRALSGSWDRTMRLWDVETGRELQRFTGHTESINSVALSGDGRHALSGAGTIDITCRLWDTESGREVHRWPYLSRTDGARTVTFTPDGRVVCDDGGAVTVWDPNSGSRLKTFTTRLSLYDLAISGDVMVTADDDAFSVWDLSDGQWEVRTLTGHGDAVMSVAVSADGLLALTGSSDRTVRLWDVYTGNALRTWAGHTDPVRGVAFSADGRLAASASQTPFDLQKPGSSVLDVRVGVIDSGDAIATFSVPASTSGQAWSVAFAPPGETVLAGRSSSTTTRWRAAVGWDLKTRQTVPVPDDTLPYAYVSTDRRLAALGDQAGTVIVWVIPPWGRVFTPNGDSVFGLFPEVRNFAGHSGNIYAAAFAAAGAVMVTGSADSTAKVWEFGRLEQYRDFEAQLVDARERLRLNQGDSRALAVFGEWYAFRGLWRWAIEFLKQAEAAGADVPALLMARSYWQIGDTANAREAFQRALARGEAPAAYINACLSALDSSHTQ